VSATHPDQLVLALAADDLTAELDERRERAITASRRTRAARRAEHLRAVQRTRACRCPRRWLYRDEDGWKCRKCGHEVTP
jgi:hypothetical protein